MEQNNLIDELSVIEVSGADSAKYLQGQLTNDINELETKPFQLSAHLNNKGRMLASFIITKIAHDTYYLLTPSEIVDQILPRIKMFVLRSKVIITKLDKHILFSNKPLHSGHELEITPKHYLTIVDSASDSVKKDSIAWHSLLICHGIPMIYSKTQESFIPQHVNYDLLNGVNFKKGCYTGQEIVARTHYLGKVKRRMFKFISDFPTTIGQKILSPKLDNQEVGVVVDVIKRDYNYLGLVALQNDCTDSAFLDEENHEQLLIQSIKYQETNG